MARLAILLAFASGCGRVAFDAIATGDGGPGRDTTAGRDAAGDASPDLAGLAVRFSFDEGLIPTHDPIAGLSATCDSGAGRCPGATAGHRGAAFLFDGIDDCLFVAGSAPVLQQTTLTIAAWANQLDSQVMTIAAKTEPSVSATADSWELEAGSNLDFNFTVRTGAGSNTIATVTGQIALGAWYHVAATWDGSNQRIYVEGGLVADVPYSGTIGYDTGLLALGCDVNAAAVQHFHGSLDEIELYDRALDATEIVQLSLR